MNCPSINFVCLNVKINVVLKCIKMLDVLADTKKIKVVLKVAILFII